MRYATGGLALALAALGALIGCNPDQGVAVKIPEKTGSPKAGDLTSSGAGGTTETTSGTTAETKSPETPPAAGGTADVPATTSPTPAGTAPGTPPPTDGNTASGPVKLQYAFSKGESYKYKTTVETTMDGFGGKVGTGKPITSTTESGVKVLDKSGEKAKIEITVAKNSVNAGSVDDKTKQAMDKMAGQNVGVKVTALFDPTGKPSEVKYSGGSKAQASQAGIDMDTGFFGISYPGKEVKPGDTWTHTFDFRDSMGQMPQMSGAKWSNQMVTTTFTLKSIDPSGKATISISIDANPSMSMKVDMPNKDGKGTTPNEVSMKFKVTASGIAVVDTKSGLPQDVNIDVSTKFEMPMGSGSQKNKVSIKKTG
ncbi:MAG: hypothetical protein JST30_11605 [Armatimonadetes bacterium]|nr:hypothetical protein [Armatimonadota bacterium]